MRVARHFVGSAMTMLGGACEWSWDVDVDGRVSSVKVAGVVTAADVYAAQHSLATQRGFDPSFALLLDLSLASDLPLSWGQARTIVMHSPVALRAPRAIVANTIVTAAMAHAFRALRDDMTGTDVVRVCRSLREAREWIDAQSDRRWV